MRIAVLNTNSNITSGILGTISTSQLLNNINQKLKSQTHNISFENMNQLISKGKDFFVNNIVKPHINFRNKLLNTMDNLLGKTPNVIRPLITKKDFENIPLCMQMPIMTYKPIYQLYKDDRIEGFNIDKNLIPSKDRYGQMINNGKCYDIIEKVKNDKSIRCVSYWKADDPDINLEELANIEFTRMYIDKLLKENIDPTDINNTIR